MGAVLQLGHLKERARGLDDPWVESVWAQQAAPSVPIRAAALRIHSIR